MKATKRLTSLITATLVTSALISNTSAYAKTLKIDNNNSVVNSVGTEAIGGYYGTNPKDGVGIEKTITSIDDFTEDMLIAQGTAHDDPRVYMDDSMNEVPHDLYALYAAYDDNNLYLMWQFTNVSDIAKDAYHDYPVSGQGKPYIDDIKNYIAISVNEDRGASGTTQEIFKDGYVWGSPIDFTTSVDHLFAFSSKPGVGEPAVFRSNGEGKFDDSRDALVGNGFKDLGITYSYEDGFLGSTMYGINATRPSGGRKLGDMFDESSDWVDFLSLTDNNGNKHDTAQDTKYMMTIPYKALKNGTDSINKNYLKENGIGVMIINTSGLSGMDCLPYDPTMNDVADQPDTMSQPKNSLEKSDTDTITVPLASVGKLRQAGTGDVDVPTKKDPTISTFAPDITTATIDQEVKFTCTASNAKSYEFTIDGEAVDDSEVSKNVLTHTFTKEGEYKVAVTAKGESGTKDATKEITFNVTKKDDPVDPDDPIEDEKELKIDSLTSDVESPQKVDSKIKFTAKASGGKGDLSYIFTAKNNETKETEDLNEDTTLNSVEWVPSEAGEYTITVKVSDGTNTETKSMKYTVSDKDTEEDDDNQDKDTIKISNISISPEAGEAMEEYTITVDASGANNLKYTFYVNNKKKQSSSSNEYSWIPTKAGDYEIEVEVSGDNAETVKKSKTYTITDVNADDEDDEKTLNVELGSESGTNVEKNTKVKLLASVDNAEGDCTFAYKVNGKQVSTGDKGDNSIYTWIPTEAGTYNITVEATDEKGNKGESKVLVVKVSDDSTDGEDNEQGGNEEETSDAATALPIMALLGSTIIGSIMVKKRK